VPRSRGQVGAETTNSIPVDAVVSLDFRLVPDETPAGARAKVEAFLRALGWTVLTNVPDVATRIAHPRTVRLDWQAGYREVRTGARVATAVIATASRAAVQPVAVLPMMGASVPL
jgi:acetylornithine deacetylase/succinyl-diaminopimelate desuccinylase-like protein